eukprot:gene16505-21863_t
MVAPAFPGSYGQAGTAAIRKRDGSHMRRVITIAVASMSLAGCTSFSMDSFQSAPPPVTVQFESVPPGADARTSLGQSCKTPCSLPVSAEGGFSVTYTLPKFQPLTVPVSVTKKPGDLFTAGVTVVEPNQRRFH